LGTASRKRIAPHGPPFVGLHQGYRILHRPRLLLGVERSSGPRLR
jgi:hypothetical protein